MKILYTIIFVLIRIALFCQTYQVAQDSLIRKHHVKQISVFGANDTVNGRPSIIYQYDSSGNLIIHQEYKHYRDGEYGGMTLTVRYFYENRLLNKIVHDQNNYENHDEDHFTDTTTLIYDHFDRLLNKRSNFYHNKKSPFKGYTYDRTISVQYYYINDTTTVERKEIKSERENPKVFHDTLIYNHDKLLLCEIRQNPKGKFTYAYNDIKQLVTRTFTPLNSVSPIYQNTFFYEQGRLIREEILSFTKDKSYTKSRSIEYEYIINKKGLVEFYKVGQISSVAYKYEYY
jgi:hypothetical protein